MGQRVGTIYGGGQDRRVYGENLDRVGRTDF